MPRANSLEVNRNAGVSIFARRLSGADQAWYNLGAMASPPTFTNSVERLTNYDERGGGQLTDQDLAYRFAESFDVPFRNVNMQNMALFLSANAPGTHTQNNTAVVDQAYTSPPRGGEIPLVLPAGHPSAGKRAYNVSAVTVTGSGGSPTYAAGTDYIVDAVKGILFIPTNSTIAAGTALLVDYTPATMTALGEVLPQTLIAGVEAQVELWEVSEGGARQRVREIPRCRIFSGGATQFGVGQENSVTLTFSVLSDPLSQTPAGRLRDVLP